MGRKCCVPNCKSGYVGNKEKVSLFKVPNVSNKEELLAKWQEAIPRSDREISEWDYVCEKHFLKDQIIREWEFRGVKEKYKIPKLKEDAVPNIFPNCSKCSTKTSPKKRRLIVKHGDDVSITKKKAKLSSISDNDSEEDTFFNSLWNDKFKIQLPNSSWAIHKLTQANKGNCILFSFVTIINNFPVFDKQLILKENNTVDLFIRSKKVSDKDIFFFENRIFSNVQDLEKLLQRFEAINVCYGGVPVTDDNSLNSNEWVLDNVYNSWRHNKCRTFTVNEDNVCLLCKEFKTCMETSVKENHVLQS